MCVCVCVCLFNAGYAARVPGGEPASGSSNSPLSAGPGQLQASPLAQRDSFFSLLWSCGCTARV